MPLLRQVIATVSTPRWCKRYREIGSANHVFTLRMGRTHCTLGVYTCISNHHKNNNRNWCGAHPCILHCIFFKIVFQWKSVSVVSWSRPVIFRKALHSTLHILSTLLYLSCSRLRCIAPLLSVLQSFPIPPVCAMPAQLTAIP